jgi:hypothetical protein
MSQKRNHTAPRQNQSPKPKKLEQPENESSKQATVDKKKYDKYVDLKLIQLAKTKLTEQSKAELIELEKELKQCSGEVPILTRTAAIRNEIVKMIEGIPMPKEYSDIIYTNNVQSFYLGK